MAKMAEMAEVAEINNHIWCDGAAMAVAARAIETPRIEANASLRVHSIGRVRQGYELNEMTGRKTRHFWRILTSSK